ncbi:MAG: preprotein translocase subunit SecE [Ezakiella sp.]|nr:preprotein translocase subunit SecE [Ezakiella sp.]MDD7761101.1 preprotein translocase subunit SecE [Bacillota bacterium]MDY3947398.1 preprotein translocase subunit SecE [Ezakiella sp.]
MATDVKVEKKRGKLATYLKGVRTESKKVIWPNKKELLNYTGVVLAFSIVFSIVVYLLDLGIGYVYSLLMNL